MRRDGDATWRQWRLDGCHDVQRQKHRTSQQLRLNAATPLSVARAFYQRTSKQKRYRRGIGRVHTRTGFHVLICLVFSFFVVDVTVEASLATCQLSSVN